MRLPSGATREGTVFYRGVDADYATQRDVSRTKRDIKTFEIRLRCDNSDRALAVGMTAYVALPVANKCTDKLRLNEADCVTCANSFTTNCASNAPNHVRR